jgi:hypothetical protein
LRVVRVVCAERSMAPTAWPCVPVPGRQSSGAPPLEPLVHYGKSLFPVSANTIEQRPHVDDGVLGAKRFRCLLR